MSDPIQKFDRAQVLQWAWKTPAMQKMAIEIVKLALDGTEISADLLPQPYDHGGQGICGSVFAALYEHGIIGRVGVWQNQVFYPKMITSRISSRKGAKIGVYRLNDRAKALAFLRVKGALATGQQEMKLEAA